MHMARDALGMDGRTHLAPGCPMEMQEAEAPLVLHIRRRLERTCPQGYLAGAACWDYMALGHISVLRLHRSDSQQGWARDASASPENPPTQNMSPHICS